MFSLRTHRDRIIASNLKVKTVWPYQLLASGNNFVLSYGPCFH